VSLEPSPDRLPLAEALQRLEAIVRDLEAENADLDRALQLFEEGVAVLQAARALIGEAELRIRSVIERQDAALEGEDLDV